MRLFPRAGLDDLKRDFHAQYAAFEIADRAAVAEARRTALIRHCLCPLDHREVRVMLLDESNNGDRIDAALRVRAARRDVDDGDQRRRAAGALHHSNPAGKARIDPEDDHAPSPFGASRGSRSFSRRKSMMGFPLGSSMWGMNTASKERTPHSTAVICPLIQSRRI